MQSEVLEAIEKLLSLEDNTIIEQIESKLIDFFIDKIQDIMDTLHKMVLESNLSNNNIKQICEQMFLEAMTKKFMMVIELVECISKSYAKNNKAIFSNLLSKIKEEINKKVFYQMESILESYIQVLMVDTFINNYNNILESVSDYTSKMSIDVESYSSKPISDFIFQYFEDREKKLRDGLECDDFSAVSIVASNYRSIIKFLIESDYREFKEKGVKENLAIFDSLQTCVDEDEETKRNQSLVDIGDKKFKVICSTFEILKFIFDIVKMVILMDKSYEEQIIFQVRL